VSGILSKPNFEANHNGFPSAFTMHRNATSVKCIFDAPKIVQTSSSMKSYRTETWHVFAVLGIVCRM